MDATTRSALDAINRAFYEERAADFSETRGRPWPGQLRALDWLPETTAPVRVLDVGCGNGRLAAALLDRRPRLDYLGIDRSQTLLALAASRNPAPECVQFARCDFADTESGPELPDGPFDWIAVMGVLHHVPGFAARQALLGALARRLAPGGRARLVLCVWRFGALARFRRRVLPWSEYNRRAHQPLDTSRLERGDLLLRWGEGDTALRYCHDTDDDELDRLLAEVPLEVQARYDADGQSGRSNRYLLLRQPRTRAGRP